MRRTSHGSLDSSTVAVINVSRIDGVKTIGRRDDARAETRLDNRDATIRIGDCIGSDPHKRINPS